MEASSPYLAPSESDEDILCRPRSYVVTTRLARTTPIPHPPRLDETCFEPAEMEAPLSSPSLNGPSKNQPSYFGSSASSSAQSSGPTSAPQSTQQQQPPLQPPPQQMPADSASPFLRDFNLVAEAAKRAQMACLMRDLEAVGI